MKIVRILTIAIMAIVLLIIIVVVSFVRTTNVAAIYELNISDVIVNDDSINISGDFISSGSVYRGYNLEQIDDSLILTIERSLPFGRFKGDFSIKAKHDMSGIKVVYLADEKERKTIWRAQ